METFENKITFTGDDGIDVDFYVLEQTRINGTAYLLVTDEDGSEEDVTAFVFKDISGPEDEEAVYEMLDEGEELDAVTLVFKELLEEEDELV